jgi:hypothetical protein
MKANNVLLLPAKSVCRYETPRHPYPDRLRVKGDRICNIRHTSNYEPLWSLPLAAVTDRHGKRHRDYSVKCH